MSESKTDILNQSALLRKAALRGSEAFEKEWNSILEIYNILLAHQLPRLLSTAAIIDQAIQKMDAWDKESKNGGTHEQI